jgi:hypothetical protein
MQTVSADFLKAQIQPSEDFVRQIWYKRRYWQESTKTYLWETNWTQVPETELVNISAVSWALDSQTLSQFLSGNVTITMSNSMNEWSSSNTSGRFAPDAGSLNGYEPYWTKFQIRVGLVLPSGVDEVVPVFTGLATDFNTEGEGNTCQITVQGEESLLEAGNAENVSTLITRENIGTGNGSNPNFTTSHSAVGIILEVNDNGIAKRAGVDYTVSDLGSLSVGATIVFTVPPLSGHVITCTYRYWYTSQQIAALVSKLATEAGVPLAKQSIQDVNYGTITSLYYVLDSQSDWKSAGTVFYRTTADTVVGDVRLDFGDTSFLTLWNDFNDGGLGGWVSLDASATVTNPSTYLHMASTVWDNRPTDNTIYYYGPVVKRNSLFQSGPYKASFSCDPSGTIYQWAPIAQDIGVKVTSQFIVYFRRRYNMNVINGYVIQVFPSFNQIALFTTDSSGNTAVSLGSATLTIDSSMHEYRFEKHPSGKVVVYFDGTAIITATDTTISNGGFGYMGLGVVTPTGAEIMNVDNIYTPPASDMTGTWESYALDGTANLQNWGLLTTTQLLSPTYDTRVSTDDITYDSYVSVVPGNAIGSATKRYLKARLSLSANSRYLADPALQRLSIQYVAQPAFITSTIADFTGLTCKDAISNYASFSDYEWGFSPDETFFFRNRSTANTPLISFYENVNVQRLLSTTSGYDRTFSEVEVDYGAFATILTDKSNNQTSAKLRFNSQRYNVNTAGILANTNDDVALQIATIMLARYRQPRRRFKIQLSSVYPQMDLGDIVSLSFRTILPIQGWYLGDTTVYFGDQAINLYGESQQFAYNLTSKIVAARFDTQNWACEMDLEEVLS